MENTINRPAVDVGTDRPRPVLAFVLALLSLPGSTIAWDLPAGGLWIGLPLGAAAIFVGIRARRKLGRSGLATAAIVIAGLALAQMAIYSVAALVS